MSSSMQIILVMMIGRPHEKMDTPPEGADVDLLFHFPILIARSKTICVGRQSNPIHITISYYKHVHPKTNRNVGLCNNVAHYVKGIMLLKDHLLDAKIFINVVSSTRHPRTM
jgi:hypothetical protein